ncbi:unnamed protein product [Aureobasidium vineae]|uniref:Uncharacterized protein n=1 Tax=Aureobasidium vineae TaxID=2773715 RepID=A0A9N8PFD7_9PEZI|nr:unnamed protein product [Aureobasidium vineae]
MSAPHQPTRFRIEDLSPEEYHAEHSHLKAEMGDSAYLALRKSEINTRMSEIGAGIMSGRISLPPITRVQEPNQISLDGRKFRVGSSEGVPKHITDAMMDFVSRDEKETEQASTEVPEEWLPYEIKAGEDEEEEDPEANERQQDQEILDGKFSVRNVKMPEWKASA